MASSNGSSAKEHYEDEKNLMKLCDFLRSSEGPAVREAIEMDKRVYYIKGAYFHLFSCPYFFNEAVVEPYVCLLREGRG